MTTTTPEQDGGAKQLWLVAEWLVEQLRATNKLHEGPTYKKAAREVIDAIRVEVAQRASEIELGREPRPFDSLFQK